MPIVRLKLVVQHDAERLGKNTLQTLADELGVYFDSEPSGTWVEVEYLPVEQYAENRRELPADMRTTLVYVLKHDLPAEERSRAGSHGSCPACIEAVAAASTEHARFL